MTDLNRLDDALADLDGLLSQLSRHFNPMVVAAERPHPVFHDQITETLHSAMQCAAGALRELRDLVNDLSTEA